MTDATTPQSRSTGSNSVHEVLAVRIETNPLGWLPVVGDCINITFTPDEARVLVAALRSGAPAQAPSREAREKEITRLATIETCARELETSYPDHAWLNAACAAIRALSVPSTPSNTPSWPDGCRDATSCARHKACMYMNCFYDGRSIAGEVERLTSEHTSTDRGTP